MALQHFGKPDRNRIKLKPDPRSHQSQKADPDPHQSQNSGAVAVKMEPWCDMDANNGGRRFASQYWGAGIEY
jgi:hypothetical protein